MMRKLYHKIKFSELSLEQTIFFLAAVAGIFTSCVGIVANIPLGLGIITVIIPALNIVLSVSGIIYSLKTGTWFGPSLFLFVHAVFLLFPMLWFYSGGATGSTMPYLIMAGVVVVIMFKGKLRIFLLLAIPVIFSIFIFLEMLYPDIIVSYPNRETQYIDLIIGLIASFMATVSIAMIVIARYHRAKLEAEELAKKLGEISITDSLTGINNRRMLTSSLDEEIRKCYETGTPLTICIMDVDHFKQVNDVYGHLQGDQVLIDLARIVGEFMGADDMLGRYGGEEFLVIFKNKTMQKALKTVESFHRAIQDYKWENVSGITVSCGVSEYVKGISYSDFVGDADSYLYVAKDEGRNRIAYNKA